MTVIHATEDTFKKDIQNGVVLVDFWATWCGPCKMISPIIDELAEELDGKLKVVKLNIEEAREIVNRLGIMSIPALYVYVNGEKAEETIGFQTKDSLKKLVESHIS